MKRLKSTIIVLFLITSYLQLFAQSCCSDGIILDTQAQVDAFPITYPNCSEIISSLIIWGEVNDLSPLAGLKKIGGNLVISTDSLFSLSGLDSLIVIKGDISLEENRVLENIEALSSISQVEDLVICYNSQLLNINALRNIRSTKKDVAIVGNNNLENLEGLHSIETIGRNLRVQGNKDIENLKGLRSLKSIGSNLIIRRNAIIQNLDGLDSLISIGNDFNISLNESLINLEGLSSLEYIGNNFSVDSNDSLESLSGLNELSRIQIGFSITNNNSLKSLTSLSKLRFIGNNFQINENENLESLAGLPAGALTSLENLIIQRNPNLHSLAGFDDLNLSHLLKIIISYNPVLSRCNIKSICGFVSSCGDIYISNNYNVGTCTDSNSLWAACGEIEFNNVNASCFYTLSPNPVSQFIYINPSAFIQTQTTYAIFNLSGKKLGFGELNNEPIDVSYLHSGLYFLRLKTNTNTEILRFMKL